MSLSQFTYASMKNFPEDPEMDAKTEKDTSDQVSLSSAITGSTIPPPPYQQSQSTGGFDNPIPEVPITPSTVFTVHAQGTRFIRFPTPSPELEIAIFNGTDTSVEPVYTSIRSKRGSGNATLRHYMKGDLLATSYRFGLFRDPEIRRIDGGSDSKVVQSDDSAGELAVKISTGCRAVTFTSTTDDSKTFKWEYKKSISLTGKKRRLMILSMHDSSLSAEWKKDEMLAALVRTDDTRTPGTKKSDAGNGGLLVLDEQATTFMNEETILATCLMMLKKEIDRQRMIQVAIMAGGAGGGGG